MERPSSNTAASVPGKTRYEVSLAEANADEVAREKSDAKEANGHEATRNRRQGRPEGADENLEYEGVCRREIRQSAHQDVTEA